MHSPPTPKSVPILPGLAALADRYDGFILDLWGTIHDGLRPWAGAVEGLAELKRRGKRVLLLSNAPRRSYLAISRLGEMGVPRDHYGDVLTSGEAAQNALVARRDPWHAKLGRRCHLLGPPKDDSVISRQNTAPSTSAAKDCRPISALAKSISTSMRMVS
jgi:ribonucleotide monophosphatase NagD (HAD superfamily)